MSVAEKTDKKAGGLGETVSVIVQALLLALEYRNAAREARLTNDEP